MTELEKFIKKNQRYLDVHGNEGLGGEIVAGLQELAKATQADLSIIRRNISILDQKGILPKEEHES